jgi:hypothetical protein
MHVMDWESDTELNLKETAVRVCRVCGTVNPAGPSETCPHLQLFRFRSIDESMVDLLERMAIARNQFRDVLIELKSYLNNAVRNGSAEVVPAHKVSRLSDMETLHKKPPSPLTLTNPKIEETSKISAKKKQPRKPPAPEAIDPRQLALLIREVPKGDA